MVKLLKDNDKDKNIKSIKKKQTSCAQEYNIIESWLFIKSDGSLKAVENKVWKTKQKHTCQLKFLCPSKLSFRNEGKRKAFLEEPWLSELITSKIA